MVLDLLVGPQFHDVGDTLESGKETLELFGLVLVSKVLICGALLHPQQALSP